MTTRDAGTSEADGDLQVLYIKDQKVIEDIKAVTGEVLYLVAFRADDEPVLVDVNGFTWTHEEDPNLTEPKPKRLKLFEFYIHEGSETVRGCKDNNGRKCCQKATLP